MQAIEGVHRNRTRTDYSVFIMEDGTTRLQDEVLQAHDSLPDELKIPLSSLAQLDKSVTPLSDLVKVRRPLYQWDSLHVDLVALERQRDSALGLAQVIAHKANKASGNSVVAKEARAKARVAKPIFNGLSLNDIDKLISMLTKVKEGA